MKEILKWVNAYCDAITNEEKEQALNMIAFSMSENREAAAIFEARANMLFPPKEQMN